MKGKWHYLENWYRLFSVLQISLSCILWLVCLHLAVRLGTSIVPVVCLGIAGIILLILMFAKIWGPYRKVKNNMSLFLSGYTAEGLRVTGYATSPETEQLGDILVKLLSSDEALNLNKRQAQYLALQNQINPHFLYNTLESIRSEAMEAGITNVMNMTEALGEFFRYTISKVENMVTLEEELENVRTYFYIQQYRFEDRLNLSIEMEEDTESLYSALLPKLTLQPVVENSIIHGIERKLGKGTVRIQVCRTGERLLLRISDDGVGMPQETLDEINRKLNRPVFESVQMSEENDGIALVNVNNRIHLICGEEYGLILYSTEGVGTDVDISLPYVTSRRQLKDGGKL